MSFNPNSTGKKSTLSGSTSGAVSQFAAATTASYSIIWPAAQATGPGQVLTNDGSGNLSWATASDYIVNTFTLSSIDISHGYVTLTSIPTIPIDTILTVIGGVMQDYGVDFTVSGNHLTWIGPDLPTGGNAALISGDILVVQFN